MHAKKFVVSRMNKYQVSDSAMAGVNADLASDLAQAGTDAAGLQTKADAIMGYVNAAKDVDVNAVAAGIATDAKAVGDAVDAFTAQHNTDRAKLMDIVEGFADDDFTASLQEELDGLRKELMADLTNSRNAAVVKAQKFDAADRAVQSTSESLLSQLAVFENCGNMGKINVNGECSYPATPANGFKTKVYHRMFNNGDGRDAGYVTNRFIKFTKQEDSTYIRIFYYDNFRTHGHTSHANWNVMVCDANGNGCAQCRDPGRVNMNKWSGHQGNWWVNDHVGGGIMGLCRRSDNRVLNKGTYQLKVWINNNRYDIYTGHNQANNFMVDEVVKM